MTQETEVPAAREDRPERKAEVKITASYLPSSETYAAELPRSTTLAIVKTAVMTFFGVTDFKDRDNHTFHLMFEGVQRDDLDTTLDALLKPHQPAAHFQLIEKITAG